MGREGARAAAEGAPALAVRSELACLCEWVCVAVHGRNACPFRYDGV